MKTRYPSLGAVIFACAIPIFGQPVEPKAGTWKTWIISSGKDFQLMETDDLCLLQRWILAWNDLVEFEIVPVVPSKDTRMILDASAGI